MTAIGAAAGADARVRLEPPRAFEAELPAMWALADAARRADGEIDRNTLEGFTAYYRNLEHCDPATDLVLARDGERLVGYARVQWSDSTDGERWYESACFVHPDDRRRGIGRRLLEWTEARRTVIARDQAARGEATDRRRRFATYNHDGDAGGDVLLRSAGYEPFRHFHSMLRPDLADIPDVPLPAGLEIRPVANEESAIRAVIAADNEAFQDHFGSIDDPDTVYRMIVDDPDTDVSLWLIAFDGDEIAGGVLNGIREDHGGRPGGWLDSVFTRRPWRQRGLARALIAQSLGLLRDRGMRTAALGVDSENPNRALSLYESCGFRVASSGTAYRKSLPGAAPVGPTDPEDVPR